MRWILNNRTLCVAFLIYAVLCAAPLWKHKHYATNLEPYPDGLFYLVHAQNIAIGKGMTLERPGLAEQPLMARILPAYSLVLAIPRIAGFGALSFYLINVLLGLMTILLLFQVFTMLKLRDSTRTLALAFYLSHASLYFFVATPMAENLALLLITVLLFAFAEIQKQTQLSHRTQILFAAALAILTLTKYTTIPVAIGAWCIAAIWLGTKGRLRDVSIPTIGLGLALVSAALLYHAQHHSATELQQFFSVSVLVKNVASYALTTIGVPIQLLWHRVGLTTLGVVALIYWILQGKRPLRWQTLALAVAHLPLILSFYATDGRYVITLLPVLTLVLALAHHQTFREHKKRSLAYASFYVLLCVAQLVTQLPLGKVVIASNWLSRSEGWQYQAMVQTSNALRAEPTSYLITALPPYLYDLFGATSLALLPLSPHQEFADKNQQAWSNFNVTKPFVEQYRSLLTQGKRVFVTNAYLSSNHEQQADYELLTNNFELRPVAQGCLNTCDTFELIIR